MPLAVESKYLLAGGFLYEAGCAVAAVHGKIKRVYDDCASSGGNGVADTEDVGQARPRTVL